VKETSLQIVEGGRVHLAEQHLTLGQLHAYKPFTLVSSQWWQGITPPLLYQALLTPSERRIMSQYTCTYGWQEVM